MIKKVLQQAKQQQQQQQQQQQITADVAGKNHFLLFFCKRGKGERLIKSMKKKNVKFITARNQNTSGLYC